jgi:two-component system CheB/CheR fusion protein
VQAQSQGLGQGTEFTLRLPLELASPATEHDTVAQTAVLRHRILIIEDNVDAAESLREVLEFEQHQVAVAYDGPRGLAKAREFQPTVILCDIGLPGMDGYEVARAIGSEPALAGVQVVALTGYALPDDLQRAKDAGFHAHMAKPPRLHRIRELLSTTGVTGVQRTNIPDVSQADEPSAANAHQ